MLGQMASTCGAKQGWAQSRCCNVFVLLQCCVKSVPVRVGTSAMLSQVSAEKDFSNNFGSMGDCLPVLLHSCSGKVHHSTIKIMGVVCPATLATISTVSCNCTADTNMLTFCFPAPASPGSLSNASPVLCASLLTVSKREMLVHSCDASVSTAFEGNAHSFL